MLPVPPGVGSVEPSLLESAIARLVGRAGELTEAGLIRPEDIEGRLEALARCVTLVLSGKDLARGGWNPASCRKDVRLIHLLRAEILHLAVPPASEPAVLRIVKALETVLAAVTQDDPDDLQAMMAQPDAFDLLLEIAHDLRSPLTSILFLAETLRGGHSGELNELQKSQVGLVYSAALGLVAITSDVMDLARDEEWWVDQGAEMYSVQDVLQGVEEMVRPMAEEKHIDLILSPPNYDRAYGYPGALSRVLLNLTTNAIKFTDKGFVEMGGKRSGQRRMEYFVRDSGRGIAPDRQRELFQPMKKRQTGEGRFFSGAGLGLSIVRRILRSIGSELQVESQPDWGSRFYFLVDSMPLG